MVVLVLELELEAPLVVLDRRPSRGLTRIGEMGFDCDKINMPSALTRLEVDNNGGGGGGGVDEEEEVVPLFQDACGWC